MVFNRGNPLYAAMVAIFLNMREKDATLAKRKHVLDADISGCFEYIDHAYLLEQLQTLPRIKK